MKKIILDISSNIHIGCFINQMYLLTESEYLHSQKVFENDQLYTFTYV